MLKEIRSKMKIQYCSDLHLEFPENKRFLKENPLPVNGDILLLAEEIVPFKIMDQHNDFFDYVADNFQSTYWLPGSHEYYYYDVADKNGKINERIRENVYFVNNTVVNHNNINLVFSTLWSSIRLLITKVCSRIFRISMSSGLKAKNSIQSSSINYTKIPCYFFRRPKRWHMVRNHNSD